MKTVKLACFCILIAIAVVNTSAWAWGRRGHAIVCNSAAYLAAAASQGKGDFLKEHSFDLSYYCNVPDFIWKDKATYDQEWFNHFINLEVFERHLRGADLKKALEMDRVQFDKTYPQVPTSAGRVWWRIKELDDELAKDKERLSAKDLTKDKRTEAQADWLLYAGIVGHYVGDISMPLHVVENHDGAITHQKGIHYFFENVMVNELFHGGGTDVETEAYQVAEKRWKKDSAKLAKMTEHELIEAETMESMKVANEVLALDRKVGRTDLKKAMAAYRPIIVKQLSEGAVFLAEHYRRALGFDFDDNRFFTWQGRPAWIPFPKQ